MTARAQRSRKVWRVACATPRRTPRWRCRHLISRRACRRHSSGRIDGAAQSAAEAAKQARVYYDYNSRGQVCDQNAPTPQCSRVTALLAGCRVFYFSGGSTYENSGWIEALKTIPGILFAQSLSHGDGERSASAAAGAATGGARAEGTDQHR